MPLQLNHGTKSKMSSDSSELGTRCRLFAQLVGMSLIHAAPVAATRLWSITDKEQRVDMCSPSIYKPKVNRVYYINSIIPDWAM